MPKTIRIDEGKVVVVARLVAQRGKEDQVLEALHGLIKQTRDEPGCLRYELNQSIDDPRTFTFIEKFESDAAFEVHKNAPYITCFFREVAPRLLETQQIVLHREILP